MDSKKVPKDPQPKRDDACAQAQGEKGQPENSLGTLTSTALFGGIPPSRQRPDPCDGE